MAKNPTLGNESMNKKPKKNFMHTKIMYFFFFPQALELFISALKFWHPKTLLKFYVLNIEGQILSAIRAPVNNSIGSGFLKKFSSSIFFIPKCQWGRNVVPSKVSFLVLMFLLICFSQLRPISSALSIMDILSIRTILQ